MGVVEAMAKGSGSGGSLTDAVQNLVEIGRGLSLKAAQLKTASALTFVMMASARNHQHATMAR